METPQRIIDLVDKFSDNEDEYTNPDIFDEENTKTEFLNPFFEELGWDIYNNNDYSPSYKEVVLEDTLHTSNGIKNPDYSFRLGGQRIFLTEAKKPSRNIYNDREHAYQTRIYGWNANLPLTVLTNFREFSIYDTTQKPNHKHNASIGRIKYYKYTDYIEKWDEIYNLFSKEAIQKGYFDKYVKTSKGKQGTSSVDNEFLKEIQQWRLILARNIALRNDNLSIEELNLAIQLTIDRIIFLRIAEDRGIEKEGRLLSLLEKENIYNEFTKICTEADKKYNSGLFHFEEYDHNDLTVDTYTLNLDIDNKVFKEIISNLYYPNSPYNFSIISTEILGKIYEQFLGDVIRLTPSHQAKVEPKPEVKKAGGVYYTPQYIVDYIVENTLGEKIKDKTPNQISKIRVIDPACGSGSFLIRAYQYLLDYHLDYYSNSEKPPKDVIYTDKKGSQHLTIREKKRILKNNIYGVDIDTLAVEVTKLSLLLKVLEDQNKDLLEAQQKLYHERALPNLSNNIKNGNSLINNEMLLDKDLSLDEIKLMKPFDWEDEYKDIFDNGGFDVIIGNPPWASKFSTEELKIVTEFHNIPPKNINICAVFVKRSLDIINDNGIFSFLLPKVFIKNQTYKDIRSEILTDYYISECNDFGKFPGVASECISFVINKSKRNNKHIHISFFENDKKINENYINQEFWNNNDKIFSLNLTNEIHDILTKISENKIPLKDLVNIKRGIETGQKAKLSLCKCGNYNVISEKYYKNNSTPRCNVCNKKLNINDYIIISSNDKNEFYTIPCVAGNQIQEYYLNGNYYIPNQLNGIPYKEEIFEGNKIFIQRIAPNIVATFTDEKIYSFNTVYSLYNEEIPKEYFYHILGILNSKMMKFYYEYYYNIGMNLTTQVTIANLKNIPIAEMEKNKKLINGIEKYMNLLNNFESSNTPTERKLIQKQLDLTKKKIDEYVYELYDLTAEEIKIIEENI